MTAIVETGLERLLAGHGPADLGRVGLIANPTAVDRTLVHGVDRLADSSLLDLVALFGPEHGIRGDAQDMISVDTARDLRTGLPVHSLYGSDEGTLEPTDEMMEGLDAMVFDVQDVGSRYYTYVWTMVYAMRACKRRGIPLVVLDRPNPIGGTRVEGGDVTESCRSFVGLLSIPNRHGMTAGEIARWANDTDAIGAELVVVPMTGWSRQMSYQDTGLPWVMPSPNMPTQDTALVYPGMCLIEGTELSEARGTTRPFELIGAPFVDGDALADELAKEQLPGVRFRPCVFTPMFQKHQGRACGGVQLHVEDPGAFLPYRTGVGIIRAIRVLWPDEFSWRTRAYEFVGDVPAIDLLTGSAQVREGIERGDTTDELARTWAEAEDLFVRERSTWLMYS